MHDGPRVPPGSEALDMRVVSAAHGWIGTPYRHQGSRMGVGCDCLGLVRGVWRTVLGTEPAPVPPYSPDWGELTDDDPLLEAARAFLVPARLIAPGRVLLFRWSRGSAAKHCGIVSTPDRMIHAYAGTGVVESTLVPSWRRRIAGIFAFPAPDKTAPAPDVAARRTEIA